MVKRQTTRGNYGRENGRTSHASSGTARTNRTRFEADTANIAGQLEYLSFAEIPGMEKINSKQGSMNKAGSRTSGRTRSRTDSGARSRTNSIASSRTNSITSSRTSSITNGRTSSKANSRTSGKTSSKKGSKRIIVALVVSFIVISAAIAGYVYYQLPYRCVKDSVTIEAGDSCPSVAEFLEWECEEAFFAAGISEGMEFNHVQDYNVTIHLYHQDIATTLHVADTIPPEVQTRDKTIMFGDTFEIEDFVEEISDVTSYEVSYQEEPTILGGGMYTIVLEVKDEGGNITEAQANLEVLQDVTPPVIEGVEEITITAGESISYKKNVKVTDDYDDAVQLQIDNSEVDTDTPGDYRVVYRAEDKYGNVAEVETVVHVKEVPKVVTPPQSSGEIPMTEEAVNAEADRILASITNSSMSQYEVIKAIYNWCHSKIGYKDGASKGSWVEGAYAGLVLRRGDCYTYAMTAKCLLTRAGITNMDIQRVPYANKHHYWNLVDIGEGWHHFDTCRRSDGSTFFYLTDAELMAYSDAHTSRSYPNGTHYYDRTLYPEIP